MALRFASVFYLCLFNTILLVLAQKEIERTSRQPDVSSNKPLILQSLKDERPNTDVFTPGTGVPPSNLKSGVVVQIFNNDTSFEEIKEAHQNWASEEGIEFEFELGLGLGPDIEFIVQEDAEGNVDIMLVIGEDEQIIVLTEVEIGESGTLDILTTSVEVENEVESVAVIINNEPETNCESSTACSGTLTITALGGGGSNCQEIVKCQWINFPRIGVQKVCRTELLCY